MQIKQIPLKDIEPLRNYREVVPVSETDPDVKELAGTMKQHGQLQACLVRLHPKHTNKYQLYIGFRRLMAAKVAGLQSLKCEVKEIGDDDILELQIIENLQRQDPHPMDEAVAFQTLVVKKKYSVKEIASRFAKSEEYITQRIKLNDLTPDLQKDFKQDKMLLGHAIALCRLTHTDQVEVKKHTDGKNFMNESVSAITDWIKRNIQRELGKAPFDILDSSIVPSAGACTACPKRSGSGNLLFADVKEKDRCFDGKCFQRKSDIAFLANVKEIQETKPDVHFLKANYGDKIPVELNNDLQKLKISVLTENKEFRESDWDSSYQVKAKGFWLNGYKKGQTTSIYLKGKKSAKGSADKPVAEIKSAIIAGIKERTKRSAELDGEKVHARILEAMEAHSTQKKVDEKLKSVPEPEHVAMMYILFQELDYTDREEVVKKFGIKGFHGRSSVNNAKAFYQSLRDLSTGELTYIIRRIVMDKHAGTSSTSDCGYIFRKMAESYKDIPIADYEKEQKEIRDRREQRAADRIAALQKKEPKKKPVAKANGKPVAAVKEKGKKISPPQKKSEPLKQLTLI